IQVDQIALAAPTGREAKRMKESLLHGLAPLKDDDNKLMHLETSTIHRLLGANPIRQQFDYHQYNKLNYKMIVVDEVSMIDMGLMNHLLKAIPKGCRVIFIGDQFQLPSVESGAILADLMPPVKEESLFTAEFIEKLKRALPDIQENFPQDQYDKLMAGLNSRNSKKLLTNCVTILDVSQRCQQQIADLSELVKFGKAEQVIKVLSDKKLSVNNIESHFAGNTALHYIHNEDFKAEIWRKVYLRWIKTQFLFKDHKGQASNYRSLLSELQQFNQHEIGEYTRLLARLFDFSRKSKILCLVRNGPYGSNFINQQICGFLRNELKVTAVDELFHGSIIMINRNDSSMKLFNGDVGILLTDSDSGQLRAVFADGGKFRSLSVHILPAYQSAFAITVHKSQGSEFDRVLMPLPDDSKHRLLSREILYTGLTRAKQAVTIYSRTESLKACILNRSDRKTGLRFW
ncbi:MAG: exodeoxyribonuclease V subunit alpha, partial [Proteobacteria bacterium]|nr:exodeoxyribonuclease V subunit alpha [Pseudomonadota bacterium]